MAFNSMLRRASKSLLPLAIRSVGSPRTFQRAIPAVLSVERRRLGHEISHESFLPFSTLAAERPSSDEKVSRVLDSEIQCAEEPINVGVPDGFPFEIQDNEGERTIILLREYNIERIRVEVDMPIIESEDEDDDDDANDDQNTKPESSSIPLTVSIFKGDHRMEFAITAFHDYIKIDSMTVKDGDEEDDFASYEGPEFDDLDESLQEAFVKYLAVRGIEASITSFLMEYMSNKDNKEYLLWLKGVKHFVDK